MYQSRRVATSLSALMGLSLLMPVSAAHAATITVGADCTLINAIQNANDDSATANPFGGDCAAGEGADTIELPANSTQTFTEPFVVNGFALPNITSELTIEGRGSTITRSTAEGTPGFTLLNVTAGGKLTLNDLTLTNGRPGSTASSGGAITVSGTGATLTLNRCTLSGNASLTGGGAITFGTSGTSTINNCTLAGNMAGDGSGADGSGGIFFSGGVVTINNSTITGNRNSNTSPNERNGGGLSVNGRFATVNLRNTLIAGNFAASGQGLEILVNSGIVNGNGNNLIGHSGFAFDKAVRDGSGRSVNLGASDRVATLNNSQAGTVHVPTALDAIFNIVTNGVAQLANNGGLTQTVALKADSPAINNSGANALSTDQRGFAANGVRDIGAFEFDGISPAPTVTALSPTSGPAAGGTRVTITGTNFGSVTGPFVKFGTANATGITRLNATTIEANAPAGTGTVNVTVTTDEGTSANNGTLDDYTYISSAPGACNTTTTSTATASAPSTNLCATGTAGAVTSSNSLWNWTCSGTGGNPNNASCTAPYGTQTISISANPTSIAIDDSSTVSASSTSLLKPELASTTPGVCSTMPVAGNPMGSTASATGVAAGTCTVKASLAASANGCSSCYQAAEKTTDITVTKKAQSITFGVPPTVVVGGTDTMNATASSGLTVDFSDGMSQFCSVSGSTVTGLKAGLCTILANQAGDATHAAAPQVGLTFSIGPGAQAVTNFSVTPSSLTFTGTTGPGGASGTLSATGGPSGQPIIFGVNTPSVCGISGNTVFANGAGTCIATAFQLGNADYSESPTVTLSFTVDKAPQSITDFSASPSSISIGGTATLSATGGASGNAVTYTSTSTGVCSVSGSTVTAVSTGTCVVAANQAGTDNYTAATQATLTVTVSANRPSAPTGLSASAGNGGAVISFTEPADDGGAAIQYYQYSLDGAEFQSFDPAVTGSPATISGLSNGTRYSIRLRAVNEAGPGDASESVSVTPQSDDTGGGSLGWLLLMPFAAAAIRRRRLH